MESMMDSVFVLWYVHEIEGSDDEKLIGVYRTEEDARAAMERLRGKPGFMEKPDGFTCDRYELNRDHWTEGFVQAD
jgi:hypothetical protein